MTWPLFLTDESHVALLSSSQFMNELMVSNLYYLRVQTHKFAKCHLTFSHYETEVGFWKTNIGKTSILGMFFRDFEFIFFGS